MSTAGPQPKRGMELPHYIENLRKPIPRPVVQLVRDGLRAYGTLTASARPLPDFLIIGTKKGGTTSLINWLVNHPHVCRMFPSAQRLKSSHYFDINYARGPQWYRSHFPSARSRRSHEHRYGVAPLVGEASPYYMFHPAVPGRVTDTAPGIKVIALLRDPVSRAYSNYWDRRATGDEKLPTFEEAIDAEPSRLAGVDVDRLVNDPTYYSYEHDHHTYLARGRYLEHLEPWMKLISPDQFLILRAESMFSDAEQVFARVQEFLGLPAIGTIPLSRFNERPRASIEPSTALRLAEYYRPHNAALYDALGEDFGWDARYQS